MNRKLLFLFAVAGLAVASAKSYTVNLFQNAMLGNTELKAGEYKVEVVDQKAVIRKGKFQGEAPVKVETNGTRFDATTVRYNTGDGTMRIQEIRLGGTNTKLVFSE